MTGDSKGSLHQRLRREELFRSALLPEGEDDNARAYAIQALHNELRAGIADCRLEDLFKGLGVRASRSKDPAKTMETLLKPKGRRGRKTKNDERDFQIAVAVFRSRRNGSSFDAAVAENARLEELTEDRVRQIVKEQCAKHTPEGLRCEAAFLEESARAAVRESTEGQGS
jgi:hypothetical protein